ncbi:MAG: DUF3307 domain-containing protein [Muribaculaceae bacterium]|nr:DUF3307 domain-containing protein [Muribaculaceae bacterium]
MILLLIKLILAHLLGDFILQSDKLCNMRYSDNVSERLSTNGIHSLIQATLSYLFIGIWNLWILPVIIFISHFLIDFLKSRYGRRRLPDFICDQAAHYVIIYLLWRLMLSDIPISDMASKISQTAWIVFTAYIAILTPTSILVKSFMEYNSWIPTNSSLKGLPNAGKWIGFLERILILTFIFTENIEGIGFLLAAKSIFRFGELNRSKDLKVTEYVLIGTFSSFTVAILTGYLATWMITIGKEI